MDFDEDVKILCKSCNHIHHPSKRNNDRYGTSCPECGSYRRAIIHDGDKYINYCDVIASWN